MSEFDYLIVGAGIAGIVLAERLSSRLKKRVLIIDKREHIGGNCHDYINDAGVLVHSYGPHYFRTNDPIIFNYLSNFTGWNHHDYKVKVKIADKHHTFPINLNTMREFFGKDFSENEAIEFIEQKRDKTILNPMNAEEYVLSKVGKEIYDAFFKGYTEKQWGVHPTKLDSSVTARIPIRFNEDDRYIEAKIQAMPLEGYTKMFEKMLKNDLISIRLGTKFDKNMLNLADKIIWCGKIDEFFDFKFGKLPYRSLKFEFETFRDKEYVQVCEQINYPEKHIPWTRTVEIKHATGQKCKHTTISKEFPMGEGEPYYPIPGKEAKELYEKYKQEALGLKNVVFLGRLAEYAYINMDQVVKKSLDLFENIEKEQSLI